MLSLLAVDWLDGLFEELLDEELVINCVLSELTDEVVIAHVLDELDEDDELLELEDNEDENS